MKNFLISITLFVTVNYINIDWSDTTKLGKLYYYPFWLIRSIVIWMICPIFLLEYWFKQTDIYKQIHIAQSDPKYQAELYKSMNRFNF